MPSWAKEASPRACTAVLLPRLLQRQQPATRQVLVQQPAPPALSSAAIPHLDLAGFGRGLHQQHGGGVLRAASAARAAAAAALSAAGSCGQQARAPGQGGPQGGMQGRTDAWSHAGNQGQLD